MRVCILIPGGDFDPAPLVTTIRGMHADASIGAVWGGDPHHRPILPGGVTWLDLDLPEPLGIGWGRLLVALDAENAEWSRAARAVERDLDRHGEPIIVLRAGSVGVDGPLDGLLPIRGVSVLERSPADLSDDGLAPAEIDLARAGAYATAAIGFAADARSAAGRIAAVLARAAPGESAGPFIELAIRRSGVRVAPMADAVAAGWAPPARTPPHVVAVDDIDRREPWHVAFGGRRPRTLLSDDPLLAAAVAATHPQWVGERESITLPGGIVVDASIRTLLHRALVAWSAGEGELPPEPFGEAGLLAWLESPDAASGADVGRYWFEEWQRRPDLHVAFRRPFDDDRQRFLEWTSTSWRPDGRSPLIRAEAYRDRPPWRDVDRRPGVNVIGYVASELGLGDLSRRLVASLDAAHVPVGALHYPRTQSPRAADVPVLTDELRYATNLITVHPDQLRYFRADYGDVVFTGRRTIAYWFWELAHVPPRIAAAAEQVAEIWAATEFVADGFRAAVDVPVRVVPIPVPEPIASGATRADLDLPEDRFVFLVTFDHLSITERKHPRGAIEAFRRAFPEPLDDGPVLVVKTLNADHRWVHHERIRLAAAGRPDLVVTDRHLGRADQMALMAASDCLVSLHRAEGLGLHLMEAMWLGTPVIATRYSGNLDFMDDTNAALVDAELVPVVDTEGYYPPEAVWAEPDLDQAADWMRRLVADPELGASLAVAGRRTMMGQPSAAETGRLLARAIGYEEDG